MGRRMAIFGWYGAKNIGDEAILQSIKLSLEERYGIIETTVLSLDPQHTERTHNTKAVRPLPHNLMLLGSTILRGEFSKTILALVKQDVLIIGGGELVSDWQSWDVILEWLGPTVWAKILKKKVMIYAVGAGPIDTPMGMMLTKVFLNHFVDAITVRDNRSKMVLIEIGVKKDIQVTADPAINLAHMLGIQDKTSGYQGRRKVGIVFTPYFDRERFWPGQEPRWNRLKNDYKSIVEHILNKGLDPVFLPFFGSTDEALAVELTEMVAANGYDTSRIMINKTVSPKEMLEQLSEMHIVISLKLDGCILAASLGIPFVGIIYHKKSYEFLCRLGMLEYSGEIGDGTTWKNVDLDLPKLIMAIDTQIDQRAQVREHLLKEIEIERELESHNLQEFEGIMDDWKVDVNQPNREFNSTSNLRK